MMKKPKIIVIVGPTASGKTSLSLELAKKLNGEVVSADSRQVYKGLDLGTGKVTEAEMEGIPHHLLDVADPKETYTVTDYVRDARTEIADIIARGKLPIIVGGTFFYVDALLGRSIPAEVEPNKALRAELEKKSAEELFTLLTGKDPERAQTIDKDNKRRLVRALEIVDAIGKVPTTKSEELYDATIIGISISKEKLKENIHARLIDRLEKGMIEEVENLHANKLSYERMYELGIEYKYIAEYLEEKITKDEMMKQIELKSLQYAKRQMTWLKRDKSVKWVESSLEALKVLEVCGIR
jgi:tRNA dimethylallyltransferase